MAPYMAIMGGYGPVAAHKVSHRVCHFGGPSLFPSLDDRGRFALRAQRDCFKHFCFLAPKITKFCLPAAVSCHSVPRRASGRRSRRWSSNALPRPPPPLASSGARLLGRGQDAQRPAEVRQGLDARALALCCDLRSTQSERAALWLVLG